jgi:hypothetical protein
MTWVCKECDGSFDEPKIIRDDPSPKGLSLAPGYYEYASCPFCGSEDIELAHKCNHRGCERLIPLDEILCPEHEIELSSRLIKFKRELNAEYFEDDEAQDKWWDEFLERGAF